MWVTPVPIGMFSKVLASLSRDFGTPRGARKIFEEKSFTEYFVSLILEHLFCEFFS